MTDWMILSILTALAVAVRDVSAKYFRDLGPMEIAAAELFWSLPILAACLFFVPIPALDATFWWIFALSLPINWLAYGLYLYAIKLSPISLTVPFLSFTPVFMILTGFLILGESVNLWGGIGTVTIVCGSYVLFSREARTGWQAPFKAFLTEKGSRLMLFTALIYSVAAVLGKKAIQHSSPLFFMYFFFLVFNVTFLLGLHLTGKTTWTQLRSMRNRGIWLGSLLVVHVGCHGLAISLVTAAYMIAVKRSSILFAVLLSWLLLKEENIASRSLGSIMMFAGLLLIMLLG